MATVTRSQAPLARAQRAAREARKRLWNTKGMLDLRADLTRLPEPRQAKVPLKMEPCDDPGFTGFAEEAERVSGYDLEQIRERQRWLEGGARRFYVAWHEGEPAYCQWLIEPQDLPAMVAANPSGDFEPLAEGEVMLEGAYTFVNSRGQGAMPDCMGQLLRIARDQGARSAITCVADDNVPSLKGCARAGFDADRLRRVEWRFGRLRIDRRPATRRPPGARSPEPRRGFLATVPAPSRHTPRATRARSAVSLAQMPTVGRVPGHIATKVDQPRGDVALAALAEAQHGVVAVHQLVTLGLGSDAVKTRVAGGRLHRIHRGVYAVGHRRVSLRGRWMAAVLAFPEGAVLSHFDAAALWDLCSPRGTSFHVTIPTRAGIPRRDRLIPHRSRLDAEDIDCVDGIPVTAVARTLLDLAGTGGRTSLRRAYEEAERLGLLDLGAIAALLDRSNGRRGVGRLRALCGYDPGPAARSVSELERLFLDRVREAGLPPPAVNVLVDGYLVDAFWPAADLVVELDGYEFHRSRAAFERDRAKWVALRTAGREVLPFTHRQLTGRGDWVVATIRTQLGRAADGASL